MASTAASTNYARIKVAIEAGEVGTPHLMHIISRDPAPPPVSYVKVSGGLFFDMTIHDFDMARFLLGDVVEVYATGGVMVDPAIGEAGDIDTAVITLKFANGAIGTIDNSRKAVLRLRSACRSVRQRRQRVERQLVRRRRDRQHR